MSKDYLQFRSETQATVLRCQELMAQACGQACTEVRVGDPESESPGIFGCEVGAGSEAPTIPNVGVAMLEHLRLAVIAGQVPYLSASERLEMLDFYNAAEDIDIAWPDPPSPYG